MARKWTAKRKAACNRRSDGTFAAWSGGRKKSELKKKQNTFQGIATHIGKEFVRQNGRVGKVGDCVRKQNQDGAYHKGADWYVRTAHGWRDTGSPVRPTPIKIRAMCAEARKGR